MDGLGVVPSPAKHEQALQGPAIQIAEGRGIQHKDVRWLVQLVLWQFDVFLAADMQVVAGMSLARTLKSL